MENKFCKGCGQKLNITSGILGMITKKDYHELEDGFYCDKCASIKVGKKRRKI